MGASNRNTILQFRRPLLGWEAAKLTRGLIAAIALGCTARTASGAGLPASILDPRDAKVTRFGGGIVAPAFSSQVRVEQRDIRFLVHAQADVDADPAIIWSTLTDYDHLAQFIPDMTSSRTVSRLGADVIVEQKGVVSVGPFHKNFATFVYVSEHPSESITMSTAGGDFSRFEARYDIASVSSDRVRITYEASIVPARPLPPLLSVPVMRAMIDNQFGALLKEITRREKHYPTVVGTRTDE
jgi:ribosome-associated toxin RatA of RatAB toxin-antitoxin module